jgi:hypothetical protein
MPHGLYCQDDDDHDDDDDDDDNTVTIKLPPFLNTML